MKILEKTQNKLVYQSERNLGIYVLSLLVGLWFVRPILWMMLSPLTSSAVEALTCKRVEPTQVNCELTKSTYMGLKKERSLSLSKVLGAKVNEKTDSEGDTFYEVVILTQKGEVLLSNNPSDASRINDFVKSSNTTDLRIDYDNRGDVNGTLLFTSLFVVIIFASLVSSIYNMTVVETYIFDKTLDKLIHHRRSCLVTKLKEYTLLEIVDVRVEKKNL